MTICTCPECGYDKLSTLAKTCPVCGVPHPFGNGMKTGGSGARSAPIDRVERLMLGHANGEPLSWLVIDASPEEGIALILSERVIAKHEYAHADLAWQESELRTWMIEDFAYGFLSSEEQAIVVGEPFVLTAHQADLLGSDDARKAWPTAALAAEGDPSSGDGAVPYWLCTKGTDCGDIQIITSQGRIYAHGLPPDNEEVGVRPAMWIRLADALENDS